MTVHIRYYLVVIFVGTLLGLSVPPAEAILDAHMNVNGCDTCHNLHGAPGQGLLDALTSEALCLSCHGPGGLSTLQTSVHNPAGLLPDQINYITCRECHDHHSNRVNTLGGTNIRLVGFRIDPNTSEISTEAKIRFENTSLGARQDVVFEVDEEDKPNNIDADFYRGDGLGPCEICHVPKHNQGRNCTTSNCHAHIRGFLLR